MLSFGMLFAWARSTARRSRVLASGSGKPWRAAIEISRASFVNSWPRLASAAPFCRLIVDHLECPDISCSLQAKINDYATHEYSPVAPPDSSPMPANTA
jgi:hypothetical protein